jgi:hypothetical protein
MQNLDKFYPTVFSVSLIWIWNILGQFFSSLTIGKFKFTELVSSSLACTHCSCNDLPFQPTLIIYFNLDPVITYTNLFDIFHLSLKLYLL